MIVTAPRSKDHFSFRFGTVLGVRMVSVGFQPIRSRSHPYVSQSLPVAFPVAEAGPPATPRNNAPTSASAPNARPAPDPVLTPMTIPSPCGPPRDDRRSYRRGRTNGAALRVVIGPGN